MSEVQYAIAFGGLPGDFAMTADDAALDVARIAIRVHTKGHHGVLGVRGGELTAICTLVGPDTQVNMIPGRIEANLHSDERGDCCVIIKNDDPDIAFSSTRVWYNGSDITEKIHEFTLTIDRSAGAAASSICYVKRQVLGDALESVMLL